MYVYFVRTWMRAKLSTQPHEHTSRDWRYLNVSLRTCSRSRASGESRSPTVPWTMMLYSLAVISYTVGR